jgi:hypothetical protein
VTRTELLSAVDAAFDSAGRVHPGWTDPHAGGTVLPEEYSRVTDPDRWRILGARVEAWLQVLTSKDLVTVREMPHPGWASPQARAIHGGSVISPRARGAIALTVARFSVGSDDDAGIALGIGTPPVLFARLPDCGCDACDSGSQNELAYLDDLVMAVVTGELRRLDLGDRSITALGDGRWFAAGLDRADDVDAILAARPDGWTEQRGSSWLTPSHEAV